ncbi:hypothetical protein BJ944DRAFT_100996 [Cunninghamella echinulata]|nr:hypothetical protein BJ944DRAFT_100996 [Cunninghamella echinulata]
MTQEGLEKILSDYVNIMDSFKAINIESPIPEDMETEDNSDQQIQQQSYIEETSLPKRSSSVSTATQPSLITETSTSSQSTIEPTTTMDIKEQRRKSFRINQHRISWTSDTGLRSFGASQHLAGELMSLFDMEFKVEISIDPYAGTAPQLPELSYFKEKQHNRSSVDSFMCLIPAFESFQIDNSYDGYSYVSKANKRISIMTNGTNNKRLSSSLSPTRSSSLKYKTRPSPSSSNNKSIDENIHDSYTKLNNNDSTTTSTSPSSSSLSPTTPDLQGHKTLTKKKSIRKLVSLFGKKKLNANESIPMDTTISTSPFRSVSSTNVSSVQSISTSPSSYSSSETNLNKNILHVDTQFNNNQRPTNPTFSSDNAIYTNNKNNTSPETQPSPISIEEKKRRRRSNSVPEISTYKNNFQNNLETPSPSSSIKNESYHQNNNNVSSEKNHLQQQYANNPSTYQTGISSSSSNISLIPTSSSSPIEPNDRLPQSKSAYDIGALPRRKQSLSRSPTLQGYHHHSSKYQDYQQDTRLYHSTHDLSDMYTNDTGGIGNILLNDSKDSVLSQNNNNPNNKKSNFMSRMTSFARRKKTTMKQPVQV